MLAHILAELKLLTTDLGRMAMSAAAVNDVTAWILLALAIALSGSGSPFVLVYVLLYSVSFVAAATFLMQPVLVYMAHLSSADEPVKESFIYVSLGIMLNIGCDRKVLNDEAFAILVLMALTTTFMTTPAVTAVYKPARLHTSTEPWSAAAAARPTVRCGCWHASTPPCQRPRAPKRALLGHHPRGPHPRWHDAGLRVGRLLHMGKHPGIELTIVRFITAAAAKPNADGGDLKLEPAKDKEALQRYEEVTTAAEQEESASEARASEAERVAGIGNRKKEKGREKEESGRGKNIISPLFSLLNQLQPVRGVL